MDDSHGKRIATLPEVIVYLLALVGLLTMLRLVAILAGVDVLGRGE